MFDNYAIPHFGYNTEHRMCQVQMWDVKKHLQWSHLWKNFDKFMRRCVNIALFSVIVIGDQSIITTNCDGRKFRTASVVTKWNTFKVGTKSYVPPMYFTCVLAHWNSIQSYVVKGNKRGDEPHNVDFLSDLIHVTLELEIETAEVSWNRMEKFQTSC